MRRRTIELLLTCAVIFLAGAFSGFCASVLYQGSRPPQVITKTVTTTVYTRPDYPNVLAVSPIDVLTAIDYLTIMRWSHQYMLNNPEAIALAHNEWVNDSVQFETNCIVQYDQLIDLIERLDKGVR